jgi:ParB family transcriptional regulator, chromosome partitioning protein
VTERRSVGDEVLEDLDALMKTGSIATVSPPARSYSTPTKLGHEMLEGAGQTIARQKASIDRLEAERKAGLVVLRLDPKRIRPSSFANRHEKSLASTDEAFATLKKDIHERGQLDPIRVRPVNGEPQFDYEIVYGHRRHAVCLVLDREVPSGFPLLALLDAEAADARQHVLRMHSENYARSDLSPFEYGRMYASWLQAKCFRNQEEIAAAIGLDQSMVSTYIRIARLPSPVLGAFGDPRTISVRWARELAAILKAAEAKVLAAAAEIAQRPGPKDPAAVLRELVQAARTSSSARPATKTETVKVRGKTLYTINQSGDRLRLKFGSLVDRSLAAEARDELKDHLTRWLSKRVKP